MHQDINGCDHDQRAATTAYHTISSYSAAAAMAALPAMAAETKCLE